jgi:hypothetical protein
MFVFQQNSPFRCFPELLFKADHQSSTGRYNNGYKIRRKKIAKRIHDVPFLPDGVNFLNNMSRWDFECD